MLLILFFVYIIMKLNLIGIIFMANVLSITIPLINGACLLFIWVWCFFPIFVDARGEKVVQFFLQDLDVLFDQKVI